MKIKKRIEKIERTEQFRGNGGKDIFYKVYTMNLEAPWGHENHLLKYRAKNSFSVINISNVLNK